MKIAVDFDATVVEQDRPYDDVTTPLVFVEGAREALLQLKRAGHLLMLWSSRASLALLYDPALDPFVRAGVTPINREVWLASKRVHRARYEQMIEFVNRELPGVFDCIDDGLGGKPLVDLFIDDKAMAMRGSGTWSRIARTYGEPEPLYESVETWTANSVLDLPVGQLYLVPTGELKFALDRIRSELMMSGITRYEPDYVLGNGSFWAADRGTVVNLPWFLATPELYALAQARYPWTWDNITRSIRHEVGHSVNYAFELWKRPDWKKTFGDFEQPYPMSQPPGTGRNSPEFVYYMRDVEPGYPNRHPDEAFAEAFACWLDPQSNWRAMYEAGTGARSKLEYIQRISKQVLGGYQTNFSLGMKLGGLGWREAYEGQTVRQALAIPQEQHVEQIKDRARVSG